MTQRPQLLALAFAAAVSFTSSAVQAQTPAPPPGNAATSAVQGSASRAGGAFQNLSLFLGLDGSKQPQDLGINANMGVRVSANLGVPLVKRFNLGAQIGTAVNLSDAAVHVLDQIEGTSRRAQTYVTLGVFQRTGNVNWSLGYDLLHQDYYDTFNLGQVRGGAGVGVAARDEVGAWFTKSTREEHGLMGTTPVLLTPVSQVNGYLRHLWPSSAQTTVWMGVAGGHNNVVWVLPDNSRDGHVLVYGADLQMPLSDRFAVTGAANFLTPTATGTVDAYLGVTFYPGERSSTGRQAAFHRP